MEPRGALLERPDTAPSLLAPAASRAGRLILLTGISGAGKTTLGRMLVAELEKRGARPAVLVDGDLSRSFFEGSLGYSVPEREDATRRMAFGAFTLVRENHDVVLANIAGTREVRRFLRSKFPDMIEVFLDAPLEAVVENDVKGVYSRQLAEDRPQLVGVDLPYERPTDPDLVLRPFEETPEESLARLVDFLSSRGPVLSTKAHTLASLRGRLVHGEVLPQVTLSYDAWRGNPDLHVAEMAARLGGLTLIVRSSCPDEDSNEGSGAGRFTSVLDVELERGALERALRAVRDDYEAQGLLNADHVQILVQPMLTDVAMSGVVFTRHRSSDSPYYVVNYDDQSGSTDSVTSGRGGDTVYLSRFQDDAALGRWSSLVALVRELEEEFRVPLDLEFAEARDGRLFLLQCRRLHVRKVQESLEEQAGVLLTELAARFERVQAPAPPQVGARTVLSDMADWNPAEMLGERPSTLAYSLYRTLIADDVWHRARASQGYHELAAAPLLVSLGRKAYVDTRASFNSLTPASLSDEVRAKLVDAYVARLALRPELHDKVEFEVACTAFDLGVRARLEDLGVLGPDEVEEVERALRHLTESLVRDHAQDVAADMGRLDRLDELTREVEALYAGRAAYHDHFQKAWLLLRYLTEYGTLPFARLARLGFIAKGLVESLESEHVVPKGYAAAAVLGVDTVASELSRDLARVRERELAVDAFLERYGHLRMSTYDLTAPRYDQLPREVWTSSSAPAAAEPRRADPGREELTRIDAALDRAGVDFDARTLFAFLGAATVAREAAKFRFTRTLSTALEALAAGGAALDIEREEMMSLTLPTLLRFRNPEDASPARAAAYLRERIREKRRERSVYDLIELPSVVARAQDLEQVNVKEARPNFVTRRRVTAEVVALDASARPGEVELGGKIVAIRAADPGFDWIFSEGIAGLVTEFGGVASHMAIRCAEFGLPGAIGCGRARFERAVDARLLLLDCGEGVLERV